MVQVNKDQLQAMVRLLEEYGPDSQVVEIQDIKDGPYADTGAWYHVTMKYRIPYINDLSTYALERTVSINRDGQVFDLRVEQL